MIAIGSGIPSEACIDANAHALARYAAICQEAGLVPIVEPEVVMEGPHNLESCLEVSGRVLHAVFNQLYLQRILLEGMILKPNMILPGGIAPFKPASSKWPMPPCGVFSDRFRRLSQALHFFRAVSPAKSPALV